MPNFTNNASASQLDQLLRENNKLRADNSRLTLVVQELSIANYDLRQQHESLQLQVKELVKTLEALHKNVENHTLQLKRELECSSGMIKELKLVIEAKDAKIVELKRLVNMDSSTSSLPPSTDKKFNPKKPKDGDSSDDNGGGASGGQAGKRVNLLEKLQQFAAESSKSPKFSVRDNLALKMLLDDGAFQLNGIYGALRQTLEKLSVGNFSECSTDALKRLLNIDKFVAVADYKYRGGQIGHKGYYLEQVSNPDKIKIIKPKTCDCGCKQFILDENKYEARQEFDVEIKRVVTEYRLMIGRCEGCGELSKATIDLPSNASYSYNIRCYAVYMLDAHFMTYERLAQFFKDILNLPISEGSINNWRKEFARILGIGYLEDLRKSLLCAKYLHADETTVNVGGVKEWVHSVCNAAATLLHISHSRGKEGICASQVLDKYDGVLIVDGWSSYEGLPLIKGIQACLAHLFRYFKDAHENYEQQWALVMLIFLSQFIEMTKTLHDSGIEKYRQDLRERYYKEYDEILVAGEKELSACNYADDHRTWRLLRRLKNDKALVLRFLDDTSLPLTNNMAERSVRPLKIHQKISGTMLSMENAQENLDIRSFIATAKKQGQNILAAMRKLFKDPFDFEINPIV